MRRQKLLVKAILLLSLAMMIAGLSLVGLVVYNGINGYSALDLPDKKVSIRIKNDHLNIF